MTPTPYRIHKIVQRPHHSPGATRPDACTLHGFLKYDGPESQHCVYNEYVALKLAQALRVPVADGVLAVVGDGLAYASLEVSLPGINLPDMQPGHAARVAAQYPGEVAALVAFDIWIGNWDRRTNLKAAVASARFPLFRAFDHSHALLNVKADATESIAKLASDALIVEFHPFYGRVAPGLLSEWVAKIAHLDTGFLEDSCMFHRPFRTFNVALQESLVHALAGRAQNLADIVWQNKEKVVVTP